MIEFDGKVAQPSSPEITHEQQVREQVKYLSGVFQNGVVAGGPRPDAELQLTGQDKDLIYYHYRGHAHFQRGVLDNYDIALPRDPRNVYRAATGRDGEVYCSNPDEPAAEAFFYFWNPHAKDCILKKDQDYFEFEAKLRVLEQKEIHFPDYQKLIDPKNEIEIAVFLGKDEENHPRLPAFHFDTAAPTYREYAHFLKANGFHERLLSAKAVRALLSLIAPRIDYAKNELPYIREYDKREKGVRVKVRFVYTNIAENSAPFQILWKDALENASLTVYSGHSGLGENLDLSRIEAKVGPIEVNENRYQIWVMDGCSTYTYYQQAYLNLKSKEWARAGKRAPEFQIVTTALQSDMKYNASGPITMTQAILSYLKSEKRSSWPDLVTEMSHHNLLSVSGDDLGPSAPFAPDVHRIREAP